MFVSSYIPIVDESNFSDFSVGAYELLLKVRDAHVFIYINLNCHSLTLYIYYVITNEFKQAQIDTIGE